MREFGDDVAHTLFPFLTTSQLIHTISPCNKYYYHLVHTNSSLFKYIRIQHMKTLPIQLLTKVQQVQFLNRLIKDEEEQRIYNEFIEQNKNTLMCIDFKHNIETYHLETIVYNNCTQLKSLFLNSYVNSALDLFHLILTKNSSMESIKFLGDTSITYVIQRLNQLETYKSGDWPTKNLKYIHLASKLTNTSEMEYMAENMPMLQTLRLNHIYSSGHFSFKSLKHLSHIQLRIDEDPEESVLDELLIRLFNLNDVLECFQIVYNNSFNPEIEFLDIHKMEEYEKKNVTLDIQHLSNELNIECSMQGPLLDLSLMKDHLLCWKRMKRYETVLLFTKKSYC
jgi:hypothetical protein